MTLTGMDGPTGSTVHARTRRVPPRHHWIPTTAALSITVIAFSLSTSLLLPVVPSIEQRYDATTAAATWVITVYMLVGAVSNPVIGRVGDLFGRRRTLLVVQAVVAVGAVIAALATTIGILIAARALQGVAAATLPLSYGILRDHVPVTRRPVVIALVGAMTAVGGGLGMPLGGLLVAHGSLGLLLWIVVAIAGVALVTSFVVVPDSGRRAVGTLDVLGAVLLGGAVGGPLLGVALGASSGWAQPWTPALVVVGLLSATAWWRYEGRRPDPLIDVRVLRRRPVALTNLVTILMGFSLFGAFSVIPMMVQRAESDGGLGLDEGAAGLLMLPCAIATFVAAAIAGVLIRRMGARLPLGVGAVLVAGGMVLLSATDLSAAGLGIMAGVLGLGFGVHNASAPNLIVASVREEETGAQTGVNQMMQNIGTSFGSQLPAVLLSAVAATGGMTDGAFRLSLGVAAGALVTAGSIALLINVRISGDAPGIHASPRSSST